ncbi:lipase family alpha/beta hydrolase [Actinoplanes couchii]|uniref:AB hydrolase-1 domain-containing protein n=1 Tax=Actinoplanes couchii TaxID=403638 RepID=A0ABQ3XSC1_9ACTN|nr:alpha/beta fold hydrolase [Actinoplanes couchii]MDR6315931.1 pimeloyl-ACP methyl ester carboxylesterase [Actinoplanes couchii]GID61419.1 hypothetical protein Aco03nite_098230 [Actinoplanes couchii]
MTSTAGTPVVARGPAIARALVDIGRELEWARTGSVPGVSVQRHARPPGAPETTAPRCLFVPGRFATALGYTDDPDRDIRLYLAAQGVEVGSVEHPTDTPAGTGQLLVQLASALGGLGDRRIVLIGHSMGGFLCYLAAILWPHRVAGIVALDGGVISPCRGAPETIGRVAAELVDERAQRWETVSARPSVLRSLAADVLAGDSGAVRSLARVLAVASGSGDGCMVAPGTDPGTVKVAAAYLTGLRDTWSALQSRQARLLALAGPAEWPQRSVAGIQRSGIPVFAAFGTESGTHRRARDRHTAVTADPNAEICEVPGYGHLDVLFGPDVRRLIFQPVLRWLIARGLPA